MTLLAQAASEVCQNTPWDALETGAALAGAGILAFGVFRGLAAFVRAVEGDEYRK